jgi:hypothetical protein
MEPEIKPRFAFAASLALVLMTASILAASPDYCPQSADTVCSNRVIERDSTKAYQRNPHGNVRSVLLYDYSRVSVNSEGRQALRRALSRLSRQYGFRLDITDAAGAIDSTRLREVDVIVFAFGSGDVLNGDTSAASVATQRFVYGQGGSILLVAAAAEYLPCGRGNQDSIGSLNCAFLARAAARQFYYALTGSSVSMRLYADSVRLGETPPHQVCRDLSCSNPLPHSTVPPPAAADHGVRNPETRNIFTGLPRTIDDIRERWFGFRSSARLVEDMPRIVPGLENRVYTEGRVNVLFSLDEASRYFSEQQSMGDHPVIWTRKMGNGLSAFSNLGHSDVYVRPRTVNAVVINDSIAQKITWRLLRYLARDFRGCMDPGSPYYNFEATVSRLTEIDVADPCTTPAALRPRPSAARATVTVRGGLLRIAPEGSEVHAVRVTDVSGRTVSARAGRGAMEIGNLEPGIYFVEVRAPDSAKSAARARVRVL